MTSFGPGVQATWFDRLPFPFASSPTPTECRWSVEHFVPSLRSSRCTANYISRPNFSLLLRWPLASVPNRFCCRWARYLVGRSKRASKRRYKTKWEKQRICRPWKFLRWKLQKHTYFELFHPINNFQEWLFVSQIENQQKTNCIAIKSRRQTAKSAKNMHSIWIHGIGKNAIFRWPFLSTCIPELQMNAIISTSRTIQLMREVKEKISINSILHRFGIVKKTVVYSLFYHSPLAKIDSNRWREFRIKNSVRVLKEKARFSNARVAQSKEFEQIIVIDRNRHCGQCKLTVLTFTG